MTTLCDIQNKVKEVYEKYSSKPNSLDKIKQVIYNLDSFIKHEELNKIKKEERATQVWNKQQQFMNIFFDLYKISYYHPSNCYFILDGGKIFKLITEDDLTHKLLLNLSKSELLSNYKHKTRSYMIKKIKENKLFLENPSNEIEGNIINIFKNEIFNCDKRSKFLLTLIGDHLLKKNNGNLYYINSDLKKIIMLIEELIYSSNGFLINISNIPFITRYHENQDKLKYKLLYSKTNINFDLIKEFFNTNSINFIVVCCYLSNKYENANKLLEKYKEDQQFYNYVNYFSFYDDKNIVKTFIENSLTKVETTSDFVISWKNMHYIWKLYLELNDLPNMMYISNLKEFLKDEITYCEVSENFLNITSKYLPKISNFLYFWDNNFYILENDQELLFELDIYDLEIEELIFLYKEKTGNLISELEVINILNHFAGNLIIENKCIINVKCYIWNKFEDLKLFFDKSPALNNNFNLDILYESYCNYLENENKYKSSKNYFSKYISNILMFD
jgi:hypothetical protein